MSATVAITGASGLLGGNLAALLVERGMKVRAIKRRSSRVDHLADVPIDWVEGDLDDVGAMTRCFENASAVYHCAGIADVKSSWSESTRAFWVNAFGTHVMLDALKRVGLEIPVLVTGSAGSRVS